MRLDEGFVFILENMFKQANVNADWDKISVKRKTVDGWTTVLSSKQLKEIRDILKAHEDAKEIKDESKGSETI